MFEGFTEIWNVDLLYAALIAILSGVIHGFTGFGAALFMVPLFAMLFGPVDAIAIAIIMGLFGSVQLYPGAARNAQWRETAPVILAIVISTPIGSYLLFSLGDAVIRDTIGAFVLLSALILLSGWVY
ncbi:MAG: sulfite exporter TauE/SafE family protein, partial [Pseudomonadota bacterium]